MTPIPTTISSNSAPCTATPPFDHAKADIILRSSDNIDFRVFKLFLSLASPFFETLFSIPHPTKASEDQEIKDGLVVIPVTEDSKTLDALLRFCYPCTLTDDPSTDTLKDALDILEVAKKYSLDAIEKRARKAITNPKILETDPLRCFAVAHRGRLREETLLAAKYTLTKPLIPMWFQEIKLVTATDLLYLLTYHQKCGDAVYALRRDLSWITAHYGSREACSWLACQDCDNNNFSTTFTSGRGGGPKSSWGGIQYKEHEDQRPRALKYELFKRGSPQWWEDFMEGTFTALRDKPCKEIIQAFAQKTVQAVKARNCQACSPKVTEGMRDFVDLFTKKIEEVVSKIELKLNWN